MSQDYRELNIVSKHFAPFSLLVDAAPEIHSMADNGPTLEATPFERALAQFKMGLKKRDLENFKKTTLVDLRQTIGELQEKQHASRRLQGLNRIQPFLEAMEQFGKVITIFANTNEILAFVWGPVKLLLMV